MGNLPEATEYSWEYMAKWTLALAFLDQVWRVCFEELFVPLIGTTIGNSFKPAKDDPIDDGAKGPNYVEVSSAYLSFYTSAVKTFIVFCGQFIFMFLYFLGLGDQLGSQLKDGCSNY